MPKQATTNVEKTKNNKLTTPPFVLHNFICTNIYLIFSLDLIHYNLINKTNYHPIVIILSLAFAIKNECKQLCAILYVYLCWLWR